MPAKKTETLKPDFSDLAGQAFSAVMEYLESKKISLEGAGDLVEETADLSQIVLHPDTGSAARVAAQRALKGIPLRLRAQLIELELDVRNKVEMLFAKFIGLIESFLGLLGRMN